MGVRTLFKGDQYVVVGKLLNKASGTFTVRVTADKTGAKYLDDIVIDPCLRQPKIVEDSSSPSVIDHFNCIQPIPDVKKSKAQEFLQSLHAFLNIQQLLKKDKKVEALALALENHFVTPVTSLVVVRPDEEDTLANIDNPTIDYDYPVVHAYYSAAPAVGYSAYQPHIHKYISAPPQAYRPQSNIAHIQPISASYDLAYVDDYAAITSTTVRNIVATTTTTTTTSTTSTTS